MAAPKKNAKAPTQPEVKLIHPTGNPQAEDAKKQAKLHKMLQAIARGGNINATDKNGQTALMYAAALNERLVVCWLVAKGADVTLKAKSGKTAHDFAKNDHSRALLATCATEKAPLSPEEESTPSQRRDAWGYALETTEKPLTALPSLGALIKKGVDLSGVAASPFPQAKEAPILEQSWGGDICVPSAECAALLLRHGYDAQGITIHRYTPADMVRLLLALGVKVNEQDETSRLWMAIATGDLTTVQELMSSGKKAESCPEFVQNSPTAEMARFFLSGGYTDAKSVDPAIVADTKILDELLKKGIDASSALRAAVAKGRTDLVRHLLEASATPTEGLVTALKEKPIHEAEIVNLLIQAGADVNSGGVMDALLTWAPDLREEQMQEHLKTAKALFKAGAKAPKNALLSLRYTFAFRIDVPVNVLEANQQAITELAELLMQNGADIHATDAQGNTALLTCGIASPKLLSYFVKNGDKGLDKALSEAVYNHLPASVEYLIDQGVKPVDGIAEDFAAYKSGTEEELPYEMYLTIAKALKKGGANLSEVYTINYNFISKAVCSMYEIGAANPNASDENGATPLMFFAHRKYTDIISTLIKCGADVNAKDNRGRTALMYADKPANITLLLQGGADINACNEDGNSAAMNIITDRAFRMNAEGKAALIKTLLDAGAKTDIRNKAGKDLLTLAKEAKLDAVVALLEKKG